MPFAIVHALRAGTLSLPTPCCSRTTCAPAWRSGVPVSMSKPSRIDARVDQWIC